MSVTIQIANSMIELGSTYILDYRPDPNAPQGMKDMTKYPFQGNSTVERVYFNENTRSFDTGLYQTSPCLNLIPSEKREELVKAYNKYIKLPYEKYRNVSLLADESNTFWQTYYMEAYVNKQFNTDDIAQLFELFCILNAGIACEADEKNPILRQDSQFTISSTTKAKGKSKQLVKLRSSTVMKFQTILETDRDKLDLILQWIGRDNPSKIDGDDLSAIYYQVINDKNEGIKFCDKFQDALQVYESDTGLQKMEWFYGIRRLLNLRKIKQKSGRGYVISDNESVWLGNTLQDIASFCINDDSIQHKAIKELIEEYPETKRPEHIKPKKV